MRQLTACLIFAVLLAGCDSPTQNGSVGTVPTGPAMLRQHFGVDIREPILGDTLLNPCNGEVVIITGEAVHRFNGVGPDPGAALFTHFEDFFKISGAGVGDSGNRYVLNSTEHVIFSTPSLPPTQFTVTGPSAFVLVSKGAAPNFTGHAVFHITVLPDGSMKVTTDFVSEECRG